MKALSKRNEEPTVKPCKEPWLEGLLRGEERAWLVSGHKEASQLLHDPNCGIRLPGRGFPGLLGAEGAAHRKWRSLLAPFFSSVAAERFRPHMQALADELLDRVSDLWCMDVVRDFASPFAAGVILDVLGVPSGMRNEILEGAPRSLDSLQWLAPVIAQKRRRPGDDMLSALVSPTRPEDRVEMIDLILALMQLIEAGHGPPTALIAQGVVALLDHPAEIAKLRADPNLMPAAVEELLRYCAPFGTEPGRRALEPFELGGCRIQRSDMLVVQLGSANRDPALVDCPGVLDIERPPSRHLSFGGGVHQCSGQWLARVMAEVAFSTLLRRLPGLRLVVPRKVAKFGGLPHVRIASLLVEW